MKRWIPTFLILGHVVFGPVTVMAQDAGPSPTSPPPDTANAPGTYAPMPGVEYYCTDATGARVELGQVICITAGCQTWMARCDMSLNVTTWRKTQDGCVGAARGGSALDRLKLL